MDSCPNTDTTRSDSIDDDRCVKLKRVRGAVHEVRYGRRTKSFSNAERQVGYGGRT